jgi:NAD-dependent DNA ligase
MTENQYISILRQNRIRRAWHKDQWFYSVFDVIVVLTESKRPDIYWLTLKKKLKSEGFNLAAAPIEYLRLEPGDGRLGHTVTTNRSTLQRLIQSIPSSKAMPLYQWLAQVGDDFKEAAAQSEGQALLFERLRAVYRERGYGPEWIEQRMAGVGRNSALLTEWQRRGVDDIDRLTLLLDEIYNDVFDPISPPESFSDPAPTSPGPRSNYLPLETALAGLGEAVALFLHRDRASRGFAEILEDVQEAGAIVEQACHEVRTLLQFPVGRNRDFRFEGKPTRQLSMFDKRFRG